MKKICSNDTRYYRENPDILTKPVAIYCSRKQCQREKVNHSRFCKDIKVVKSCIFLSQNIYRWLWDTWNHSEINFLFLLKNWRTYFFRITMTSFISFSVFLLLIYHKNHQNQGKDIRIPPDKDTYKISRYLLSHRPSLKHRVLPPQATIHDCHYHFCWAGNIKYFMCVWNIHLSIFYLSQMAAQHMCCILDFR